MTNIIQELEQAQLKNDLPEFRPGDTVRVQVRVKEGDRERLQAFEGVVIAKRNRGLNSSFTVRKIFFFFRICFVHSIFFSFLFFIF